MKLTTYAEIEGRRIVVRVMGASIEAKHFDLKDNVEARAIFNGIIEMAERMGKQCNQWTENAIEIRDFDYINYALTNKRKFRKRKIG